MRRLKTVRSTLTSFVLCVIAVSCARTEGRDTYVPASWKADAKTLPAPIEAERLGRSVDTVLKLGLSAVEDEEAPVDHGSSRTLLSPTPGVAWKLRGLMWQLGLSVEGALGLLLGSGRVGFEIIYGLSNPNPAPHPDPGTVSTRELTVADGEAVEVPPQWGAAIHQAVAQGKIRGEARLRSSLQQAVERFREITRALASVREKVGDQFYLHGFQMEITFDAQGNLITGPGVGAVLAFRLNWVKEDAPETVSEPRTAFGKELQSQFESLVRSVSANMDRLATSPEARAIDSSGYRLMQMKPYIGISPSGKLGIVSASAEWVVMLRFFRKESPSGELALEPGEPTVPVISGNTVTQASGREFARGLTRAMRIAEFFAKHARKARSGHWKVNEFSPSFEVHPLGSIGVVSVEGTAGLEITFEAKE